MEQGEHVHTEWLEAGVEGRINQLLHLVESIDIHEMEDLSAECHGVLSAARDTLDAKMQLAAMERARRIGVAVAKAQESMDSLHDGHANAVGERMGITSQPFV